MSAGQQLKPLDQVLKGLKIKKLPELCFKAELLQNWAKGELIKHILDKAKLDSINFALMDLDHLELLQLYAKLIVKEPLRMLSELQAILEEHPWQSERRLKCKAICNT